MPMIASLVAKIGVSLLTKLITETFLSRLLIEGLRAWARQTKNHMDDRLVEEAAKAFGVPVEKIQGEDSAA